MHALNDMQEFKLCSVVPITLSFTEAGTVSASPNAAVLVTGRVPDTLQLFNVY